MGACWMLDRRAAGVLPRCKAMPGYGADALLTCRIHVYRFLRGIGGTLRIEDEEFFEVKPGLSSFASDPRGAADSLRPLIDVAKQYVP